MQIGDEAHAGLLPEQAAELPFTEIGCGGEFTQLQAARIIAFDVGDGLIDRHPLRLCACR
ncbi:hypothetical protein D3C76_1816060 [compost metagenome]